MTAPPADPEATPLALLIVAVAVGGAAGAVCRFLVSRAAAERFPVHPWLGTLAVNLAGCFLIGLAMYAAAERGRLSPATRGLIVTGFLGGLTTFSTFGQEAVSLVRGERLPIALLHVGANVLGGLALVWAGRRVGTILLG
ncbi:fluoride efflux transporter CrcB [Alienimonas californiensis]|uniref:Fluoride-specific ion channel FluC n=1 Tax=Alienimonas californiensis TaxID=2527989 RepID=A0A517P9R4_9PLAN|nr:fluoride efflux transporter CrcB [Alienimonas californiensis]QDT16109.1 Putative fluoride ion transporter CrcB [Alienimonas californiensis]